MALASGCASNSTRSALANARRNRSAVKLLSNGGVTLQTLKKDGQPSKMHDAQSIHASREAALAFVAQVRGYNPGRTLRYSINGEEV